MITFAHNLIQVATSLAHSPLFLFLAAVGVLMIAGGIILDVIQCNARKPLSEVLDNTDPDYDLWNE